MLGVTHTLIYIPLIIFVLLPIGIYCYSLYVNTYWKRKKIPYIPAAPVVGNLLDCLRFKKSVAEVFDDIYFDRKTISKPFIGIHFFHKPALIIKDPELIKRVLVKDFSSFSDRYVLHFGLLLN